MFLRFILLIMRIAPQIKILTWFSLTYTCWPYGGYFHWFHCYQARVRQRFSYIDGIRPVLYFSSRWQAKQFTRDDRCSTTICCKFRLRRRVGIPPNGKFPVDVPKCVVSGSHARSCSTSGNGTAFHLVCRRLGGRSLPQIFWKGGDAAVR